MSFCKYCGRQLQDGEVCTCQQAQQSAGAAQPQQEFNQQAAQQNHDETFFHGNSLVQSSWTGRNAWRRPYHMSFQAGFPA